MLGFTEALRRYQSALEILRLNRKLNAEQALNVLIARDEIHQIISYSDCLIKENLVAIYEADCCLRKYGYRITSVLEIDRYSETTPSHSKNWWWDVKVLNKEHPLDKLDYLINLINIGLWSICIGLLAGIISKFVTTNPDLIGGFTVSISALLTALKAKSELTKAGQNALVNFLKDLKVPTFLYEEAKLLITLILATVLSVIWLSLDNLSDFYISQGKEASIRQEWSSAKQSYERAIALNNQNWIAHHHLGLLYENMQDVDKAEKHYKSSILLYKPNKTKSINKKHIFWNVLNYNSLGRIYI